MKTLIIPIILFIATACGGGAKKESAENNEPQNDPNARTSAEYEQTDFVNDKTFKKEWNILRKKFKSVPYVVKTEIGNLYLFANSKYELPEIKPNKQARYTKSGLVDGQGNILLECKYEKIGNPGAIASEYMEIQQFGKYGLFNYKTKQLIPTDFDVIFPSRVMGYVAIGQKGNDFFKLYEDGRMIQTTDQKEIPSYKNLGEAGNFDINDKKISCWVTTYVFEEDESIEEVNGLIFTPSYLAKLKIIPEFIDNVMLQNSYFGMERLVVKPEIVKPRNKRVDSFLEYYHEVGADARGWETERRHLVTVDKKNKVIDSKKIAENNLDNLICDAAKYRSVKFLNDSLIEVKGNLSYNENYSAYFSMSVYSYFEISDAGKIIPLHPESFFEMASVVKLTEAHLKGCFAKLLEVDYEEEMEEGEEPKNLILTSHLSLFDLEYMRNEIYARHGLAFKDSKWQSVFADKDWYRGTSGNVDKKLTPLEKENIKFIMDWENKLKNDEEQYTQPQYETYHAAG